MLWAMAKHRVTMVNVDGIFTHTAVDFVPAEDLDTYVSDARTRWASVEVSETPEPEEG